MTENESTTKELTGKEKRLANLKPINEMSEDEKKDFARKGGIARGEQRRKQRTMKEQMLALLNTTASREQAEKYLGEADAERLTEDDMTYQGLLSARMWQEAMQNGNAKAAEFVRDTSGQRPKDVVEVTANVMTEADRNLMANMAEILGAKADKTE